MTRRRCNRPLPRPLPKQPVRGLGGRGVATPHSTRVPSLETLSGMWEDRVLCPLPPIPDWCEGRATEKTLGTVGTTTQPLQNGTGHKTVRVGGYAALQDGTGEWVGGEGSRRGVCGPIGRDCRVRGILPTATRDTPHRSEVPSRSAAPEVRIPP